MATKPQTPKKFHTMNISPALHAEAVLEAARECKATGQPVTWQDIIRRWIEQGK